jgi:hypothetical protein
VIGLDLTDTRTLEGFQTNKLKDQILYQGAVFISGLHPDPLVLDLACELGAKPGATSTEQFHGLHRHRVHSEVF